MCLDQRLFKVGLGYDIIRQDMWWRALQQNMWKLAKSDCLKLAPILGLAFYIAFIPHLNYPYPVHVDEWVHLACSNEIIAEASAVGAHNPFTGGAAGWSQSLEVGFHLFWVIFQQVTDIPWLIVYKYFPAIIFMITVLSVYILGRREGFSWKAALCTCFVPTTLRFLGPAFLVPVALGLLFIPLSLFIAFNFRNWQSYVVIFVFTCFLVSAHAYTAVGLIIVLTPYIVLNLRKNFRHSLGIFFALVIPFLGPLLGKFHVALLHMLGAFITPQPPPGPELPYITQVPHIYGYLPILLFAIGTFLLAKRGRLKDYSLLIVPLLFVMLIGWFFNLHRGIQTMYSRSFLYLMLMMGVVAGYGLRRIRDIRLPEKIAARLRPAFISRNAGNILCLILLIPTMFLSVRSHLDTPYYHMIDTQAYEAFVWVRENIGDEYDKAILDPWKATAFTAISGKKVHSRIHAAPHEREMKAYSFLRQGCRDTAFLKQNGISIVYTRWGCNNPDLVEVRKHVYLLKEAETE